MALYHCLCGASGGSAEVSVSPSAQTSLSFSNKSGKKLILTMAIGWTGMTDNNAKIGTISGGSIIDTNALHLPSDGNTYYACRFYEIDVTSNTLTIGIQSSSVVWSAVFVDSYTKE